MMRIVLDTNILLTFFWRHSVFKEISQKQLFEFFSPEYALEEINKYAKEITKKANISKKQFENILSELAEIVDFVAFEEYSKFLKEAKNLTFDFSREQENEFLKDLDFYALSLKLNCPIWSNDLLFKKQQKIYVLNTKEIIDLLFDLE